MPRIPSAETVGPGLAAIAATMDGLSQTRPDAPNSVKSSCSSSDVSSGRARTSGSSSCSSPATAPLNSSSPVADPLTGERRIGREDQTDLHVAVLDRRARQRTTRVQRLESGEVDAVDLLEAGLAERT